MLGIFKNAETETKNAFDGLISRLDKTNESDVKERVNMVKLHFMDIRKYNNETLL
jgi:hypothetical protein